eukprot:scaffold4777_cov120-Skeletonema_dohrnii-CCMP3373.AAC.8
MVASPAPSTRLARRAVSQRRLQRKTEQSPVKQQQEKTTISTATGADASNPSKNWWLQGGLGSNSTDDMTVSSQSVASNVSNGTGASNLSAAANRRRLRKAQQKDAPPTDKAPALNISVSSNSVPKTVTTPRATNSLSRSIFALAQNRMSGNDASITTYNDSSNASAVPVTSPTPLATAVHNSRSASNRFLQLSEERDKLQNDAKLFEQKARSAMAAKNVAEQEKNEAVHFMEHQIESLQDTLRAVTEQMGKVQINEQAMYEKQLIDSKSNVAVLQRQLQQMAVENEGLKEKVGDATKAEKAMADMKRNMARTKNEHASVVDSLRKDLATAKRIRDDKQSSFQSDVESLKQSHAEEVSFYKKEIEEFKQQLKIATDRSGAEDIERKLAESKNVNSGLAKQLKQAQDVANRLKFNSEKDMQLLESELEKTHKAKVDVEHELKETKRQLSSALRNLDEMAVDGEKMRSNVEGMMAGFTKEKGNFQNEMALLKRDREEKLALMDELRRDKIAVDIDSKNLQQNVSDLEMKLRGAEKFIADLENEVKSLKGQKRQNAPEQAITEIVNVNQLRDDKASLQNQLDSKEKSMIDLRQTNRDVSMKLSKAQQTIHKLQSKEKYLESRVESLSNQISQTVHDYEMKLVNCERRYSREPVQSDCPYCA